MKAFEAYICKKKNFIFADLRKFNFANNNWVRKSQKIYSPHIANPYLRTADLCCYPAHRFKYVQHITGIIYN